MLRVHFISPILDVEDESLAVYDTSCDIDTNVFGDLARVEWRGMDGRMKVLKLTLGFRRFPNLHFVILPGQIDASDHARQSGSYNDRFRFSHGSILFPFNLFIANSFLSGTRINLSIKYVRLWKAKSPGKSFS